MHKGVMSIPVHLLTQVLGPAVELIARPTLRLYDKVAYNIYCQ